MAYQLPWIQPTLQKQLLQIKEKDQEQEHQDKQVILIDFGSDVLYDDLKNYIKTDFKENQDSTNIHLEDFHNCKPPPTKPVLHYHLGQDISGHDSCLGIISVLINTTILNTPLSGKKKLFIVGSSNILIDLEKIILFH